MCFCHQADCMPWEPVILGAPFYFEHSVWATSPPTMVRKMKQVSALLKQHRFFVSHMCAKKTKHPNNSESRVYNNDPCSPTHLFKSFTHLTQGQTSSLHYHDHTRKTAWSELHAAHLKSILTILTLVITRYSTYIDLISANTEVVFNNCDVWNKACV